jgi:hypothetical protein
MLARGLPGAKQQAYSANVPGARRLLLWLEGQACASTTGMTTMFCLVTFERPEGVLRSGPSLADLFPGDNSWVMMLPFL